MSEKHQDPKRASAHPDIYSLEYAVQLIMLLAVGLLAFSFL
jgi:hypothetical protein